MTESTDTTTAAMPTLASQLTNVSSDTDFTELTAGTSIKTQGSCTRLPLPDNIERDQDRLSINGQESSGQPPTTRKNRANEIRKSYQAPPPVVPDLEGEMEKWFTMADRYGFLVENSTQQPNAEQAQKEVERSTKWARMAEHTRLNGEDLHIFKRNHKFVKRIFKGIPDCWRRDAWYFLCTDGLRTAEDDEELREQYKSLLSKPSQHERQIDLDIARTMHGHIMFRQRYGQGQRALFNVLRAFSGFDTEVGYCQGMTNIVAMLLMYCEEERSFTALVHMFLRDGLHDLFIAGFPALMESFYIQEQLVERYMPKLHHHLMNVGLSSDAYATRWYITLFTGGVVSYQTLLRIWDVYFLVGFDIFYFVAIALLKTHQDQLLTGEFDQCITLLGSTMTVPDDDRFMKLVKRLYERGARYIPTFKSNYKSKKNLWYCIVATTIPYEPE
ncbi:rab-GTPase-TBC domain-containing protein [Zychaea mexicana]|uniref:rab-GTPase-TBC domain-containing protein n=1 Tax=Zychaea mexicana TaxID=64656 RepID=UPI0022FF0A6F|nr:rab-GTPase-TBC domain-containing protein [Zychaea mexicana]KAI9499356.1 rab-GTPase-TBC domain-containing protein [Zychaea mexicana]